MDKGTSKSRTDKDYVIAMRALGELCKGPARRLTQRERAILDKCMRRYSRLG